MNIKNTLKYLLLIGLWCYTNTLLLSQVTISNGDCNLGIPILDDNCIEIDLVVTGTPGNQLGQNVFLEEVRLIISHIWRNDLQVILISPDGNTQVKLINERGASTDNFGIPMGNDCSQPIILTQSVCIQDSAKNIVQSTEAVGIFVPEEDLSNFYLANPFNPNATWKLMICDVKPGDGGALEYAELVFVPSGCTAPTDLDAFNVGATTIDLDWNNNGLCGGNVIVEYGPEGFTPGNGTVAGDVNSQVVVLPCFEDFDLTGLAQLTTYDIYVRQICNPYIYLYNSCKVTVQTDCILPPITLLENFDQQADCGSNGGNCIDCPTIDGTWQNIAPDNNDEVDWIVYNGRTLSSNTGPTGDIDINGKYIYMEGSLECNGSKEAFLVSDCIKVEASVGICHLSFYHHMFGININRLFLEITTDGTNWTNIWSKIGDQGNQWNLEYINLSNYHNQIVQFRFRGFTPAFNFAGDIALDRIIFYGSTIQSSAVFYADLDGDGFGNPNDSIAVCFAAAPANFVLNNTDCDDNNSTINPGATEIPCNNIDENCNGNADDILIFNPSFSVPSICSGETASITASPSNDGQIFWFDDVLADTPIDSGVVFSSPILNDTTTYYFQESKNFSGQTCESAVISVEVIVNQKPIISNASGNQNICQNTSFDLKTLIIQDNNNATDTLLYFINDSYSNTARISNPIVTISDDSIFYIQAVSNAGCTDELSVSFFKQAAPTAIINTPDSLNLCFQSDPQLITAVEGGTGIGAFDYNWSTGAIGNEAVIFSRSKGFSQTISVTVTSQTNACSATGQIVVNTLSSISSIEVLDIQEPGFCQEDGAIIVAPRDGQAPYNYAWSGAGSGNINNLSTSNYTISNLEMGAYNITVSDNFGCSKALPQQFVNGPDLGIDNITDVFCFGQNNGAITILVGGLINPTYQWSDGSNIISTNQNLAGLSGGVYSVTVDADNVSACPIDSIVVVEPPLLELLSKNILSPSCAGFTDGSIDLVVTGGTSTSEGYNFNWDNSLPNTSNPQNLAPGLYNLTISDALGCTTTDATIIAPTPPIQIALTGTIPKCVGQDDGEISSIITGGTAPYAYEWSDDLNQTTSIAYGLVANTYTLKITDANGCEEIANNTLLNPTAFTAQADNIKSPLCKEINDGEISLTVNGGTGNYNYLWSTMATTANLTAISQGIYSVSVSDDNNCEFILDSILVSAPELMDISFTSVQNPLCFGVDNGSIDINVNGGIAPYDYDWNDGKTNVNINNLTSSDYYLTVTDANGCTSLSDTINLQAAQLISIDNFLVIDSILCKGLDNGVVFYRVSSDAPSASSFSFRWQDSTLITDNSNGFWLSSDFTSLKAGNYGLEIQDNIGCILETNFEVQEPPFLKIDTVLVEAPSCFGENDGNAFSNIVGGTAPYTYSWTLPNNRIVRTNEGVLPDIDGGNYQLEIIDENNCVSDAYAFEVSTSNPIEITITNIQEVSCSKPRNGIIDIEPSGGQGGFNFEWNNGLLTEDLENLAIGTYTLTLTDAAECTASRSFEMQLQEDSLQIELITLENPNCSTVSDGAVEIKVKGGFGRYQYFWSNGVQTIGGDTTRLENLAAGNYNVSIIDENNEFLCLGFLGNITLTPAGDITVNLDSFENRLKCFGDNNGAFFITPNGGNAPYNYLWSNGSTEQNQENLSKGNYTLTVTDAKNCEWTSEELLPEILEPNNPLAISNKLITDSLCVGDASGQIDIEFIGGTMPYTFKWNNGANTASIQNLLPGNYSLTATDQNDCSLQFDTTIAFKSDELEVDLLSIDLTCFDDNSGFIQAKVICGLPPYQYAWSTGDTTENLINLEPGGYQVTVTDAAGGEIVAFSELRSPPLLQIDSIDIEILNCEGMIELAVSGGVPNSYNYTWRDESGTIISTNRSATNLAAGNYRVTVQDANNCTIELNDLLIDDEMIIDSISTSSVFNQQSNRGTLRVDSVHGGTAPFSYLWFNKADDIIGTNAIVTGVVIGDYYVIVSDQNDCDIRKDQAVKMSVSIIDLEEVASFSLYPNPTHNTTFLGIQFTHQVDVKITLMNAIGEQLFQTKQINTSNILQKIDLSNYSSGLFYLKIIVNGQAAFGEKIFYIKN